MVVGCAAVARAGEVKAEEAESVREGVAVLEKAKI